MYTLIIKQGKRIDGSIIDILIKDGKIEAAGPELANNQQAEKVIDLQGKLMSVLGGLTLMLIALLSHLFTSMTLI